MIGIDTNVLVRFLVVDDPVQNDRARAFFAARSPEDPAFVSSVTLAETVWVLHRRMKYPLVQVVTALREMLASEEIRIEHADELGRLLHDGNAPAADIGDHLISWAGIAAGCTSTVTFDRRAASFVPSMELLA
jgi:predicted nucleic-acid-binding protein